MTKKELASKVGEILGISKDEQKIALDFFLQKISDSLAMNESIKIPDIGIFQLKRTESSSSIYKTNVAAKSPYQLLYAPSIHNQGTANVLAFNVTPEFEKKSSSIDDVFSISIGKPLIPLSDSQKSEFELQSSFIMLQSNYEEKLNNLIESGIRLKDLKIDHELLITEEDLIDTSIDIEEEKMPEESEMNLPGVPWDFGFVVEKENEVKDSNTRNIKAPSTTHTKVLNHNFEKDSLIIGENESTEKSSDIFKKPEYQKDELLSTTERKNNKKESIGEELKKDDLNQDYKKVESRIKNKKSELTENLSYEERQITQTSKKKSYLWIWITIPVVILIGAGLYYFIFYLNEKESSVSLQVQKLNEGWSVEIEDSTNRTDTSGNSINTLIINNSKPDSSSGLIRNDNKNILVRDYIYSDGNRFTLQISSWKTRSVAENEIKKLRRLGYDAYIMIKNPNSSNRFFCVRIGDFASLNEAEQFYGKLK